MSHHISRTARLASAALALPLLAAPLGAAPAGASDGARYDHAQWSSTKALSRGRTNGTRVGKGAIRLAADHGQRRVDGRRYDRGTWVSPWASPGFTLTELIPSWQANTRRDTFIIVRVRGRRADGSRTRWDNVARWTNSEKWVQRATYGAQDGDGSGMNVDTWQTPGVVKWQVRVNLFRRSGTNAKLAVRRVGSIATRVPSRSDVPTSTPTRAVRNGNRTALAVPRFSQMVHRGHYPRWGGGGEAWCSPTSVAMVLDYWDALPRQRAWRWVEDDHPAPWVDHSARKVFDHRYDGAGNWSFNTAWSGNLVKHTHVTRLPNLRKVERWIGRDVPVVTSIAFDRGELDNAPISASNGHLLVVVGFQKDGDVIVNDPAADTPRGVRRVYDRAQFEDVWQTASDGTAYIIRD